MPPLTEMVPPPRPPLVLIWPVVASATVVAAFNTTPPARPEVAFAVTVPATAIEPADEVSATLPPSVPFAVTRPVDSIATPCGAPIETVPPLPCVPFASTAPATVTVPLSD